jgi:hypothetical protein
MEFDYTGPRDQFRDKLEAGQVYGVRLSDWPASRAIVCDCVLVLRGRPHLRQRASGVWLRVSAEFICLKLDDQLRPLEASERPLASDDGNRHDADIHDQDATAAVERMRGRLRRAAMRAAKIRAAQTETIHALYDQLRGVLPDSDLADALAQFVRDDAAPIDADKLLELYREFLRCDK